MSDNDNWAANLAAEKAMGYFSDDELRLKYKLEPSFYAALLAMDDFKLAVSGYRKELHDGTTPLRTKAKRLLWDTINELKFIAQDSECPASDRVSAIREIAKLAGEGAKEEGGATATATIQIVQFARGEDGRIVASG